MRTVPWLPHLLLSLIVFACAVQGLGYRALWQDEMGTAERAPMLSR